MYSVQLLMNTNAITIQFAVQCTELFEYIVTLLIISILEYGYEK